MRRVVLLLFAAVLLAPSLFAQDWRDRGYNRPRDNAFEIEPFVGYRWGGTIFADSTTLYGGQNVDLQSSASVGANFAIPTGMNGVKVELMVNHQSTTLGHGNSNTLFSPGNSVGDFGVTYYHAGLLFPFNQSRGATPFFVVSAGMTNLDPKMSGVSSSNKFSVSTGIGVKVPISPALSIRGEVRGYFTAVGNNSGCNRCAYGYNDNNFYQGEANLGLTYRF